MLTMEEKWGLRLFARFMRFLSVYVYRIDVSVATSPIAAHFMTANDFIFVLYIDFRLPALIAYYLTWAYGGDQG